MLQDTFTYQELWPDFVASLRQEEMTAVTANGPSLVIYYCRCRKNKKNKKMMLENH